MSVEVQSSGYTVPPAAAEDLYYDVWRQYSSSRATSAAHRVLCLQARLQGGLRGPAALPMDWNIRQVEYLLNNMQIKDYEKHSKVSTDRVKSARERGHCKQKFDHAIVDQRTRSPCRSRRYGSSRQLDREQIPTQQLHHEPTTAIYSGPTREGSPLYNKRAVMLSKIRVKSEPPPESSLQFKTQNQIEQTIRHYSKKYKLKPPSNEAELSINNAKFVVKERASVEAVKELIEELVDQIVEKLSSKTTQPKVTQLASAPQLFNRKLVINTLGADTVDARPEDLITQTGGPTSSSTSSSYSRSSSIERRKQIKHWVDDISVSDEENENKSSTSSVKEGVNKDAQPTLPEPPPPKEEEPEPEDEEVEPESTEISPPNYICPSSEEKSREYAVRLWITTTEFKTSTKTLPMTNHI